MNQVQMVQLKDFLNCKHSNLESEVNQLKNELSALPYQTADLVDQASLDSERQLMLTRINYLTQNLKDIRQALAQMDGGKYGICELCGEDIGIARLRARPSAGFCVSCQEMMESMAEYDG